MKRISLLAILLLVTVGLMAQLPGAEAVVLKGLNSQLEDNVNPIVFPPFGTVVSAEILKDQIDKYFPYIKTVVNGVNSQLPNYVVQVTGYANPPGGKDTAEAKAAAQRISTARANAVRDILIAKGLNPGTLVAVGVADADRVTSSFDAGADAWGKNRRVILKIVKK